MNIIALSGKKKVGKDIFCKYLLQASRLPAIRVAFADALKIECAELCKVSVAEINEKKEHYRPFLQWWGMHQRMVHGEDYWIKQALHTINNTPYIRGQLFIITDMRLRNEFDIMNQLEAHTVRVCRPTEVGNPETASHISETDLDNVHDFNTIILNTGSLKDLEREAVELLKKLYIPIKS